MNTKVMFSSGSGKYETPQWLFDQLNNEFHFTLDPCATKENAKCKKYYTKEDDGLLKNWSRERIFINPPYGKEIGQWVEKAYANRHYAKIIVMLLPARTDTKWFHKYIYGIADIRFIAGRLKFKNRTFPSYKEGENNESSAPFPSMIVIFNKYKPSSGSSPKPYQKLANKLEEAIRRVCGFDKGEVKKFHQSAIKSDTSYQKAEAAKPVFSTSKTKYGVI